MKTGVVIALKCGGSGNKIFSSQDKVTEKNFPPGNFDKLVAQGFIRETTAPEPPPVVSPSSEEDILNGATSKSENLMADETEKGEAKAPPEPEKGGSKKNKRN